MYRKFIFFVMVLLIADTLPALDLYNHTRGEKSFNIGLRNLFVADKYYPAFELGGYAKYAGFSAHIGRIYSEKPFEEFGGTKDLGFFFGGSVFTKFSLFNIQELRLAPGLEYSQHRLTAVDDNVYYHLWSLDLGLEFILIKRIKLKYSLLVPFYRSSAVKFTDSSLISLFKIHYFFSAD